LEVTKRKTEVVSLPYALRARKRTSKPKITSTLLVDCSAGMLLWASIRIFLSRVTDFYSAAKLKVSVRATFTLSN
jgi:hypothetical protein